mgnify:CR=1 FL=1
MMALSNLLMMATPAGPGRDLVRSRDRGPEEPDQEPADFRDRDLDMSWAAGSPV